MKRYNTRFLIIGIVLAVIIFLASLALYPAWQADLRSVVALLVMAFTSAFGFLNNVKPGLEEKPDPVPPAVEIDFGGGPVALGDMNILNAKKITDSTVIVGNGNIVTAGDPAAQDPNELYKAYLNLVFEIAGRLQLSGIDPKAASEQNSSLSLGGIYTALMTRSFIDKNEKEGKPSQAPSNDREEDRISALTKTDQEARLVLLGDPGSGKSTFVNFLALCLAGDALQHPNINVKLLTAPLPEEDEDSSDQPSQSWRHGALLPVRVVLRDFVARGLPPKGEVCQACHLLKFLTSELTASGLKEYAPFLEKHLHEKGGIFLFDGLDEVPEADERREQIKQMVENVASAFPKAHILITSRTYAYQGQGWRLNESFAVAELAPFSRAQISQFTQRWYAQVALTRKLDPQDAQGRAQLLKERIFSNERLYELAERPLLLTLMASLHAWRGGNLPEKREQLYSDTVDLLLDWWQAPKSVRDSQGKVINQDPSLEEWLKVDREQVRKLLNKLAFEAHAAQSKLVGTADIPQANLVTGLMRITKKEIRHALLIEFLRDRAGLLLPRGEGVYTFPHRTFQEYLAACWLTDDDYPDTLMKLACQSPDRWREVTLLAGAKAVRGSSASLWSLVDALCDQDCGANPLPQDQQWGAQLAGQLIIESADLTQLSERYQRKTDRVKSWLARILGDTVLPARERVLAGRNLAILGDHRPEVMTVGGMQFCFVPEGPFTMGEGDEEHEVRLPAFWMAQFPVTQAQFAEFTKARGYLQEGYWQEAKAHGVWSKLGFKGYDNKPRTAPKEYGMPFCLANHPVVGVSWYEALAFCRWMEARGKEEGWLPQGYTVKLPSEAEWEKAARSQPTGQGKEGFPVIRPITGVVEQGEWLTARSLPDAQEYPWKGKFDSENANIDDTGIGSTSAVGCFAGGMSAYGCQEQSGNVWEWTSSLYLDYLYSAEKSEQPESKDRRVLRGGSWGNSEFNARCAYRYRDYPDDFRDDYGFRVVVAPPLRSVL